MLRRLLPLLAAVLFVIPPLAHGQSSATSDGGPVVLVLAPDRGFLGNDKARDVVDAVREHTSNVGLAFATYEKTTSNLQEPLSTLDTEGGVVVLPLFLSTRHALYQTARKAMPAVDGGVRWAAPFGHSYLSEEILFDRVAALSEGTGDEALVLVGHGATDNTGADSIRTALQPAAERAAAKYGLDTSSVVVQYTRMAPEKVSRRATKTATKRVRAMSREHERIIVVPFNLGMQYTSMMSSWTWMKRPLQSIDGVVANGEGILPHPNVERWVRRTATTYRPLSPDDVGVIAVPHGSEYNWNETMRTGLSPLTDDYTIAEAFSMVDPVVVERAVRDLEDKGMKAAVMVRIFSLERNFQEKAHYVLGLQRTFGRSIMGERFPERIRTHLQMTTLGGLEASPHFAKGLLDRAQSISETPSKETVILLAHGTGSDGKNAHWMNNLRTIADTMRAHGGDAFRDIEVHTWREDWPEKRKETIPEIQKMVREASQDGTALVIPARTTAEGRASEYLDGLDYRYGKGFAPHPEFEAWMREQIETGIDRLQDAPSPQRQDAVSAQME
jgi:predicted esterase